MRNSPEHYYRTFDIPKAKGFRRIDAPRVALKIIQRWIHDHILVPQQVNSCCLGFIPVGGIFPNCEPHVGRRNMMNLDIRHFFGSIGLVPVIQVFEQIGFPFPVAHQLADLCSLHNQLPQGSPASPMLSNLTMQTTDNALQELAQIWEATYTRYADDMTFSSDTHVFTGEDVQVVGTVLGQVGLQLNVRKTRLVGKGFRHEVTGLSAAVRAIPIRRTRRRWRAEFHAARKFGAGEPSRLLGLAAFVSHYDPKLGADYFRVANELRKQS